MKTNTMVDVKTSDFYYAVYLVSQGEDISEVSGNADRLVFHFGKMPQTVAEKFHYSNFQTDPRLKTILAFKHLKAILRKYDVNHNHENNYNR